MVEVTGLEPVTPLLPLQRVNPRHCWL